jgi:hypothetical protein
MDIPIIIGTTDEIIETLLELACKTLADEVSFIADDEKTTSELLSNFFYDDFIKAR